MAIKFLLKFKGCEIWKICSVPKLPKKVKILSVYSDDTAQKDELNENNVKIAQKAPESEKSVNHKKEKAASIENKNRLKYLHDLYELFLFRNF